MKALLPFALGYALSYVLRSANAALAEPLAQDLALSPSALGLLTSLFYLAFALAQLPLGRLLDRLGPRRTLGGLFAVAGVGCLLFAWAKGWPLLALGRVLMGVGVALALVGALRAYQIHRPQHLNLLSGATVALGGLGGLLAASPLVSLEAALGWRGVFGLLGFLAWGLALAIRWGTPPEPPQEKSLPEGPRFRPIPLSPGLLAFAYIGGFFAVQSFWAGAFAYAQGLSPQEVGRVLSGLNLASILGALGGGGLAARLGSGRALLLGMGLFGLGLHWASGGGNLGAAYALMGLGGGFNGLVLAHTATLFPHAPGRAMAGVNLLGVLGIFALQAGLGPAVEVLGYRGALLLLALLQGLGALPLLGLGLPARGRRG
jgi:MFS family permease